MNRRLAVLVVALAAVVGCNEPRPGSIAGAPIQVPKTGAGVGAPIAVELPRDVRPPIEHEGDIDRTSLFITLGVYTHWEKRGSYVTNDLVATQNAPGELHAVLETAIAASGAATVARPGMPPRYRLETDIEHLYATHYGVYSGTVIVVSGSSGVPKGGGAGTSARQYASYGNVVLNARLVEDQGGRRRLLWEEHVSGFGEAPPAKEHSDAAQKALLLAVGDAASTLAIRLAAVLDRLGAGPARPPPPDAPQVAATFLIERVSRLRDFIEYVTIESATGRALRHDVFPLSDRARGRPGEWLLSRRTADGSELGGDAYDAFARALAARYDLRTYDDVSRYHFFGRRGVSP